MPATRWDSLGRHGVWALLLGVGLALARWFPFDRWEARTCLFLEAAEIPCPFCGMTRSVSDAAKGDLSGSWHQSPLGLVLFAAASAAFLFHLLHTVRGSVSRGVTLRVRGMWIVCGLVVLFALNWCYRLAMGFDR